MRLCLIAALLLLSACQLTLPGRGTDAALVNPITAGAVTVTSLDAGPSGIAPPATAAPAPPPSQAQAPAPEAQAPASEPPPPEVQATPQLPKSAAQVTCEKRKGTWSRVGTSGTMTCVTQLRDSGKQCRRDRDCEGQCLARSRTCAPFSPMFGCNEVLQDDGRRMTLCID